MWNIKTHKVLNTGKHQQIVNPACKSKTIALLHVNRFFLSVIPYTAKESKYIYSLLGVWSICVGMEPLLE